MATSATADIRAEFLVEPFVEGAPGHHVTMALEACRSHGLEPEMGPFATVIVGPTDTVTAAVESMSQAAPPAWGDRRAGAIGGEPGHHPLR